MHVLVCEDDELIASGIVAGLGAQGFTVERVATAAAARAMLKAAEFDIMVLDLGLPDEDGLKLLQQQRSQGLEIPVLILTARDSVTNRVDGLQAGADDYLIKPFDLAELKARLRALLRRSAGRAKARIEHAGISLDPGTQQVSFHGQNVPLTPKEYQLLHELLSPPGRVMTRERLTQLLYGWNEEAESNTLEVHIHHLRRKFSADLIRTVRGVGYLVEERR